MATLSDLTVVILSYQRPSYLLRNMQYWSAKLPTVIVLDGSEGSLPSEALKKLAPNIRYHWMHIKYEDRLKTVIPMVQTKYVVQLSDDEYFLPSALESCIREMETDKDVIACVGRCLNFWPRRNRITVSPRYACWPSIMHDSRRERMEAKMETLHALTIYGVMRRENWLNCIRLLSDNVFSCCYVMEHEFELFSSFQGKSRVIDVLSWLRSGENHPKSFKQWNRDYFFHDWYLDPKNADEVQELYTLLIKHARMFDSEIDEETTSREFRGAIEILVNKCVAATDTAAKFKRPVRRAAELIAANLPKRLKYPLKAALGLTRDEFEYREITERLLQKGIASSRDDLRDIEDSLMGFYS